MASSTPRLKDPCPTSVPSDPCRPSLLGLEADVAVLRAGLLARVAGVGHHPYRDDVPGFLAEGEPVILEYVAVELTPLADTACVDDDRLDLAGGDARGDGADRGAARPAVHDDRVRHPFARERFIKPQRKAFAQVESCDIAVKGDDHARRRVVARGHPGVEVSRRLQDAPAPLDHRMARRIDVNAAVEPRGRAVRAPVEHHARPLSTREYSLFVANGE